MPYIKQKWRLEFDLVINTIDQAPQRARDYIGIYLKNKIVSEVDGCLNYVFTRILKNSDNITDNEGIFIRGVIIDVYLTSHGYFELNRLMGLIAAMLKEFRRRDWLTPENHGFLVKLDDLIENSYVIPYEDKKIEENGDIDD